MGDFEHSQAEENHQNAKQRYDEKKEEISELEAQEEIAKQKRDDEIQKARRKIQKARQAYEVESKHIGQKILLARKDLHGLEIECRNGFVAVQSTARRAKCAQVDVLVHNGGVQRAADIIVAHTLNSPMQGSDIRSADQPPPFALPSPAPVGTAAAAAAGRGGGGNTRRSARLSTSRHATPSMLAGESKPTNRDGGDVGAWNETKFQPKQIISESEPWSKCDDEDDIISISSGGSESDDDINKCGRRSNKKAPAKSSKKKMPAKTPNSRRKRIKDMTPEEYKAYRRPINRRGQASYRAKAMEKEGKLDDALELISRSPALQKQKNADNHLKFANKVVDIMADTRKDAFALAKDMIASID